MIIIKLPQDIKEDITCTYTLKSLLLLLIPLHTKCSIFSYFSLTLIYLFSMKILISITKLVASFLGIQIKKSLFTHSVHYETNLCREIKDISLCFF